MPGLSPVRTNHLQTVLFAASMGLVIPLVFQHLEVTYGASASTIGVVAAVFGGIQVLVRVPAGRWIDRRGERGLLVGTWLVSTVAGLWLWMAGSLVALAGAFTLYGLAVGTFWVASNTLASRLAPTGGVARAMNRYMVATGLGYVLGPLVSGLADPLGFPRTLALLTPISLAGLLLATRLGLPAPHVTRSQSPPGTRSGFHLGVLAAFFFGILVGTADAFVPTRLAVAGFSAMGVGLFIAGREGVNLLSRLATTRWVTDRSGAGFLAVACLAEAAGLVLFPRTLSPVGLGLAAAGMGLGIGLLGPASLTLTARGSPPASRGRAMGHWGTWLGLGMLVGPAALGPLGEAAGLARIFEAVAVLSLLLAGLAVAHQVSQARR